jgi:hypothetical protein
MATTYRPPAPIDLPEVRDRFARRLPVWLPVSLRVLADRTGSLNLPMPEAARPDWNDGAVDSYVDRLAGQIARADLYAVTDEMTTLIEHAAASVPAHRLRPEDLPSATGMVFFDRPIWLDRRTPDARAQRVHVVAASWGPMTAQRPGHRQEPGVWMCLWADTRLHGETNQLDDVAGAVRHFGPYVYAGESFHPWDVALETIEGASIAQPVMLATWLLMGQRLAAVTDQPPHRNTARRALRAGRDAPRIRVVELRRRTQPAAEPGTSGRHLSVQFVVGAANGGFWRQQWYPSEGRHHTIWINAFAKGPKGAPFKAPTQTVRLLRK